MFCSRLRGRPNPSRFGAFSPLSSSLSTRFTRRSFSQQWDHQQNPWAKFPVRVLAPTAWTIAAVTTIYVTCAAWEVYEDVRAYRAADSRRPLTFERLEQSRKWRGPRDASKGKISPSFPMSYGGDISPGAVWQSLSEPGKVVAGIAALNFTSMALVLSPSNSAKQFIGKLAHVPVDGMFRNRQLLTSAFVHSGPFHLLANMFVLSNFGSSLANNSPIFRGSGSHTAAFLLSGATISALGSHISTKFWPNKMHRFRPGVGFSGAVSATFAAFCMQRPDARIHIFPFPWEFSARDMLQFSAAFEALGVLGAWRFLRLDVAFACHLTGLAFGAAYVSYGKRGEYWTSSRHAAFRALQSAKVI